MSKSAPIIRGVPNYIIYPLTYPQSLPSAYMVPFKINSNFDNKKFLELELTKILYNNWLKNRVFPKFIMSEQPIDNLDKAILMAKKTKCDLLIYPQISYLMFGGKTSTTRVAIKIDIYDTEKGLLIWSITHAGEIKPMTEKDYIFWKIRPNMSPFPEAVIIDALSTDIYPPIKRWVRGEVPIFLNK